MAKTRKSLFLTALAVLIALIIGLVPAFAFAADGDAALIDESAQSDSISFNLSLDESIALNIITGAVNDDGSKLVVGFRNESIELINHTNGRFVFTDIAPQYICEPLTATLYSKDGVQVATATMSVQSYLMNLLGKSYEDSGCSSEMQYSAIKELAVNLLNYAAAAQLYVGYKTDSLANSALTDADKALATAPITSVGSDKNVQGDAWVGAGVRFDYRLGMYFVFEAESLEGLTASINGKTVAPQVYNKSKNQYIIRYSEFDATDMNSVITAKLEANGEEQTYAYSIRSYVNAKGASDTALANLVNAAYVYGYSAVAYKCDLIAIDPTFDTAGEVTINSKGYDFSGSEYTSIILPAFNCHDYTLSTRISSESAAPNVTTTYTLKHDTYKYSANIVSDKCIKINGKYYSNYELELLNSDDVSVTYDEEIGYVYNAKTKQTISDIAAFGADLTLLGEIVVSRDANQWNHFNNISIGNDSASCSITVNNNGGSNWAIKLMGGADMYVAEGSSFTVAGGVDTYSIFSAQQGTTIVVDGTVTTSSIIRLEQGALDDESSEYGFLPSLYVRRGTVTIEDGQLITNSVQVGSEKYGYSGTLNITQTKQPGKKLTNASNATADNTISYENRGANIKYVFANGNLNLNNKYTEKSLTGLDARTTASCYIDFGSGMNVSTSGPYTYLVGCWTSAGDYRYGVHSDAKFNCDLSGNALICVGVATSNYFITYSDVSLNIDGKMSIVRVASYSTSTAKRNLQTSLFVNNDDGTKSIADITVEDGNYVTVADSSVALCNMGSFEKAAFNSNTIYYKIIGEHKHELTKIDGVDSTCSATGYEAYYKCECGKIFADADAAVELEDPVVVTKKPHTEVVDAAVEATCKATGLTEGKHCGVCGEVVVAQTETPKKAHTEVIDEAVAATCKATGLTEGKHCSACGEVLVAQSETATINHTPVTDAAVAATCKATGLTEGSHCGVCNDVLVPQIDTPMVAHTYDDNYDAECNVCGFIRDADCAHISTVVLPAVDATCLTDGLTAGEKCNSCGEILVAQKTVSKFGHTEVIDTAIEATCLNAGLTEGKHCEICQTVLVEQLTVNALGHDEVIDAAVAASCTSNGYTEGKHCSRCAVVIEEQYIIDALGHRNVSEVAFVAPTVSTAGVYGHFTCTDCNGYFLDAELTQQITTPVLPALTIEHYTTTTVRPAFAVSMSVTTTFTLISDEIEYSVDLKANSILAVDRGGTEIVVTKYDYQKLNTDIVTVTYDDKTGYVYSVAEGYTETGITGIGIRSGGAVVTITGNVEMSGTARFGFNNGMIIGTEDKPANVTVKVTNSAKDAYGIGVWDGAYLTINKGSTLNINNSSTSAATLYVNTAGSIVIVDGTLTVNNGITVMTSAATNANYEYGYLPSLYIRHGTVNCNGQLKTNALQIGSEKENASGTLNVKHSDNNITHSTGTSKNATIRYTLAKGTLNLNNTVTGKCAMQLDTSKTAYIDIKAGMTVNANVKYGSVVGEWTVGTYYIYIDTGITFNGTVDNFTALSKNTKTVYFYNTEKVTIDGVEKTVVLASCNPATSTVGYYKYDAIKAMDMAVDGADYTSTDTTETYGNLGAFTKATYTVDGVEYVIYYQEVK